MPDTTTKYSDEDLQEFKEIILKKNRKSRRRFSFTTKLL